MADKLDFKVDYNFIRKKIFNFTSLILAITFSISLFASISRVALTEFKPIYIYQTLLITVFWLLLILKNKINLKYRKLALIISLLLFELPSIPTWGMGEHWGYTLLLYSFLIALFYGLKPGLLSILYSFLHLSILGYIFIIRPNITEISLILTSEYFTPLLFRIILITSVSFIIVYSTSMYRAFFINALNNLIEANKTSENSKDKLREAQHISHIGHWELDLVNNKLSWSDEIYRIFN